MERGMNVLALVKGSERYVFLYDDESLRSLLQTMGRYAADPDLSFTWYDAAILSQKVRRMRDDRRQQHFSTERFPRRPNGTSRQHGAATTLAVLHSSRLRGVEARADDAKCD